MINPNDIKVGAQFRTRNGKVAEIEAEKTHSDWPWKGNVEGGSSSWSRDGRESFDTRQDSDYDLIELVQPQQNMNKTYYCKVTNPNLGKFIIEFARKNKLFPHSYIFGNPNQTGFQFPNYDGHFDWSSTPEGKTEVSIDEFLALLEKPNTISIKLNDQYMAEVSKDMVKVGCQTFPFSKIEEIVEAHAKLS